MLVPESAYGKVQLCQEEENDDDDDDDDDDYDYDDGRKRREASEIVDTSTPVPALNQTVGPRLEKIEHRNVSSNSSTRNIPNLAQITHRNMTGPEKIEHRNIPKLAQIIRRNMTGTEKIEQRKISGAHQNITHRKISEPEKIKHRVVRGETKGRTGLV